jgi:hypothetical protein
MKLAKKTEKARLRLPVMEKPPSLTAGCAAE